MALDDDEVKKRVRLTFEHHFRENENWKDPKIIREIFSNDNLDKALGNIAKARRVHKFNTDGLGKVLDEIKSIIQAAKEIDSPHSVEAKKEDRKIIIEASGTPESFHHELKKESFQRKFLEEQANKNQSNERKI